jgi:hypothetical protein
MRRKLGAALGVGVAAMLAIQDAGAWSESVRRAIASTAIQLIKREQPDAFKATTSIATHSTGATINVSYEEDVWAGAADGTKVLTSYALTSDEQAVLAVGSEIQLLRTVRQYGMGSYFAYRMGVLGALVSELVLPFSLDSSPEGMQLSAQINADVDAHFSGFRFSPDGDGRRYIRTTPEYFKEIRSFVGDDRRIIADDYARGKGYGGILSDAAEIYFGRSVEAVADAWYTVLREEPVGTYIPPSDKIIARYFVEELAYLLNVKHNMFQAEKTYLHFDKVNPGLYEDYERIGDLFYGFGTPEAQERGVREWKIAYEHPGPQRARSSSKLTAHYLSEGEKYNEEAQKPGAPETLLESALTSFKQALEYDRSNALAAQRINETTVSIQKKRERRQFQDSLLAQGTKIIQQAEKSALDGDFGAAIHTYNQAVTLFEAVSDEFADLEKAASDAIDQVKKGKRDVVNSVLQAAEEKIAEGDKMVDARDFENAGNVYRYVETIVSAIPEGEGERVDKEKADTIARAQQKVVDAENAKKRLEAQEAEAKKNA